MFLDGAQLVVDYECERLLPGWVPRRLGQENHFPSPYSIVSWLSW